MSKDFPGEHCSEHYAAILSKWKYDSSDLFHARWLSSDSHMASVVTSGLGFMAVQPTAAVTFCLYSCCSKAVREQSHLILYISPRLATQ